MSLFASGGIVFHFFFLVNLRSTETSLISTGPVFSGSITEFAGLFESQMLSCPNCQNTRRKHLESEARIYDCYLTNRLFKKLPVSALY